MEEREFLELFRRYLRSRGLYDTRARERIAAALFRLPGHVDAAALGYRLRQEGVPAAPATVYRTLELLVQAGLARKFVWDDRALYEAALGRPHHEHLLCTQCGRIVEFHDAPLEERIAEVYEEQGFRPASHQVLLFGICPRCSAGSSQ